MPLETGTTIADLNASNPAASDGLGQTDDHLRLIKSLLLATFPNISDIVTGTAGHLNQLVTGIVAFAVGSLGSPSIYFTGDSTTGFYRPSSGKVGVAGQLTGNGAVPVGSLHNFPKVPSGLGTASTPGTKYEYLELNGALYLIADYPELAAFLGTTYGGNGTTTFGVPDTYDTGRFLRSRTASVAVGTEQANALKTHTHTGTSASNGAHTHTGTTDGEGAHEHFVVSTGTAAGSTPTASNYVASGVAFGTDFAYALGSSETEASVGRTSDVADHTHDFTTASNGAHTHTFTTDATGDTETRPEALSVIMCIKT